MAEIDEGRTTKGRSRPDWSSKWRPGEPLPWVRFWWQRWLSDPLLLALSPEQLGRFVRVFAASLGTKTPGIMTEDQVRNWAGYSAAEWRANREAFLPLFNTTRTKGKWRIEHLIEDWKASLTVAKRGHERARKGGEARARKSKGDNAGGPTSTAQAPAQAVLGQQQMSDTETQPFGLREIERSTVPDPEPRSAQAGSPGHSPVASGGTVAVSDLLGRALRAGCADGPDGTARASGGGA